MNKTILLALNILDTLLGFNELFNYTKNAREIDVEFSYNYS